MKVKPTSGPVLDLPSPAIAFVGKAVDEPPEFPRYSIDIRRKRRPPAELVVDGLLCRATGRVGDMADTHHRYGDTERVHEYVTGDGDPRIVWVHDDGTPVDMRDVEVEEDE